MVIYLMGEDGRLHYTALKEANWKDEVLKHFLQRLLEIKPAIEIDPEYKYFLEGKYDETGGLRGNSSAGTAQTIGVFLKARGEKLEDRSLVRKFFEKFM